MNLMSEMITKWKDVRTFFVGYGEGFFVGSNVGDSVGASVGSSVSGLHIV